MTQKVVQHLENSIEKLKRHWSKPFSKEVSRLFDELHQLLKSLKNLKAAKKTAVSKNAFHFVKVIQEVLKALDILFLNRRLSYHVVATTDLPLAYGSEKEALTVLTELLSTTARHTSPGSKLEIGIQNSHLREGVAIQTKLEFEGKRLTDLDRQRLLEELYANPKEETESEGMAYAKTILRHVGGGFWLEFPSETRVALTFHWPASARPRVPMPSSFGAYKYDIWLIDYGKIRKRFGIPKSEKLVRQIEEFTRSLVRHPTDIVVSFPAQGMVTAIYESQEGAASSVTARISQRLSKEPFKIGKKSIVPKFRYQLTFLA